MPHRLLFIAALIMLGLTGWAVEEPAPVPATPPAVTEAAETPKTDNAEQAPTEEQAREGWHVSTWRVDGRLDYQVMHMRMGMTGMLTETATTGKLMAAEVETTATIASPARDVLDLAVQWPYATQMTGVAGRGKEMHFFNAYGIYKLGLGKPNVRVGQFVVPFGNLTYYETHTRALQSLYPQSLGIRIDRGVSVEGFKGNYDYWLALVGGNGARKDNNHDPIVVGRVSRRLDLPQGILTVGASALYGKDMPRFSTLVDPVMGEALPDMPLSHSLDFTNKTRVGVDAEYSAGPNLWRAELVTGRDADGGVNGQFLQWNRALSDRQEVSAQLARWEQPGGTRLRLGGSYGLKTNDTTTIRLSAERSLGRVPLEKTNETMISLQLLREFPGVAGK